MSTATASTRLFRLGYPLSRMRVSVPAAFRGPLCGFSPANESASRPPQKRANHMTPKATCTTTGRTDMAGSTSDPDFDRIYNREWFMGHHALRDEYRAVANVIHDVFYHEVCSCIDVGCGMAFVIERLAELGWGAIGVDGSKLAIELAPESVRGRVSVCDLTVPHALGREGEFGLVICTEVAEHLRAEFADTLVSGVAGCMRSGGFVMWTAATPGQGGNDHVNEQPHEYWISRFEKRGLNLDKMRTGYIREQLAVACNGMHWFGRNTLVFK
jgi:SAM-dependent methyltransferase